MPPKPVLIEGRVRSKLRADKIRSVELVDIREKVANNIEDRMAAG